MARVALIMRCIGRKTYQTITLSSLHRMDGLTDHRHALDVYAVFTPTKRVGVGELADMQQESSVRFVGTWIPQDGCHDVNTSAGFAMQRLVELAQEGRYDFYAYTEGDVLFNPGWLDQLLELREHVIGQLPEGKRIGIGCPIDMAMGWYEPVEHDIWFEKKWMAAQCYVMDQEAALQIKLDDPIYSQPASGWDKEMPSRLSEQGFVHFTPKGESWAQHIGFYGVTANGRWPLGVGFEPAQSVMDLWLKAYDVTRQEIVEEYER